MKSIILLGAGGHAKVVLEMITLQKTVLEAVVTPEKDVHKFFSQYSIMQSDNDLLNIDRSSISLVNGIGSTRDTKLRKEIYLRFKLLGFSFASLVHPSSVVSTLSSYGEGVQIMAGVVIQPGSSLGNNIIINTHASVDHDCNIADHVHVGPGVTLSGGVTVGEGTHIGTGATVIQGITIGKGAMIAAGAVVVKDVYEGSTVMGIPARTTR